MQNYTKEDIVRMVKEEDVEFIRLQFTDILGSFKNIAITANQLEKALNNRFMFDGSSVEGFVRVEESDMILSPDLNTFEIMPWRPQQGKVARLICNVLTTDGKNFEGDPRYCLIRAIEEAKKMGYEFEVGPECEFFLFHMDDYSMPTAVTHEQGGYFDVGPVDMGENIRRDIVLNLEDMGFDIEASHHEGAPAQHEIDFRYGEALDTADKIMTFKLTVKSIARRHGMHATFMPKPIAGENGSGMHLNMSLYRDGVNMFEDPSDPNNLSQEAYYFMGGLMKHIKAITAITNPIINSYKRLVPNYEAPVYISWGKNNRSPLIRIPSASGEGTRIELRSPDPAANPYLALAVCLQAGLDGIQNKIMPPAETSQNIYTMTKDEIVQAGIESLPVALNESIEELRKDEFIQKVLGSHISEKYIEAKVKEWDSYRNQVSKWELDEYLLRY